MALKHALLCMTNVSTSSCKGAVQHLRLQIQTLTVLHSCTAISSSMQRLKLQSIVCGVESMTKQLYTCAAWLMMAQQSQSDMQHL
jgi:hypothetical protein